MDSDQWSETRSVLTGHCPLNTGRCRYAPTWAFTFPAPSVIAVITGDGALGFGSTYAAGTDRSYIVALVPPAGSLRMAGSASATARPR